MGVIMKNTWKYVLIILALTTIVYGQEAYNQIRVSSKPSRANVYLDGKYIGKSPLMYSIRTQKDTIQVDLKQEGYQHASYIVSFSNDRIQTIDATLSPIVNRYKENALTFSLFLPGSGQLLSNHYVKGSLQSTAFIVTLLMTINQYSTFNDQKDRYLQAKEEYKNNVIRDQYEPLFQEAESVYNTLEKERNRIFIFGAFCLAAYSWSVLDAYFNTQSENASDEESKKPIFIGFSSIREKPVVTLSVYF